MIHKIKHPFDGSIYILQEDGRIHIQQGNTEGYFRGDGRWIEGELRQADPQLCVWISNRPMPENQLSDWGLSPQAKPKVVDRHGRGK